MKQIIPAVCALLLTLTAKTQPGQLQVVPNDATVNDTVHYYFNKFYFKTGKGIDQLPKYRASFATATVDSHVGSRFNNNETIVISGIDVIVAKDSGSTKPAVPVHLYLCTLQNNKPVLPPLDCVEVTITSPQLSVIGGNFKSGLSHTLTTDFAVLLRNVSIYAGDFILVGHTGAKTATNTSASPKEKFGEGNGYVRYGPNFFSTTNSTITGFGIGTDYEFCIAPRVQYTITSDHIVAANAGSVCTFEPMIFTNSSSKKFLNPQFNLVEFKRKWDNNPPFADKTRKIKIRTGPNPPDTLWVDVFTDDPPIGWYFASEDNLSGNPDPRVSLPSNTTNNQITFFTDSALVSLIDGTDSLTCFQTNEFRTRYKAMALYGRGASQSYDDVFMMCTSFCNKDGVGLGEQKQIPMRVYPNPSTGIFSVEGLKIGTHVKVYDVAGVLVKDLILDEQIINLSDCPKGLYIARADDGNQVHSLRIMKD